MMRRKLPLFLATTFFLGSNSLTPAQDAVESSENEWTVKLEDGDSRGQLSDLRERVRGDSGKWRDDPGLLHATRFEERPAGTSLDDWADHLASEDEVATGGQKNWLVFRTVQLDDNDRVWVDKIQRRGNEIEVEVVQAKWQGNYRKNFTYFQVLAVDIGKLPPGEYTATWTVKPATFKQFDDPKNRNENWPVEERILESAPKRLTVEFKVVGSSR